MSAIPSIMVNKAIVVLPMGAIAKLTRGFRAMSDIWEMGKNTVPALKLSD